MAHTITQIVRVLNKLKNNDITEDKDLCNISYDKLENLKDITEYEKLIILQYGAAIKNHKVTAFLQSSKSRKKGDD